MNAPGRTDEAPLAGQSTDDIQAGHIIVSLDIQCTGQTAFVQAQTSVPVDELELRAYPVAKAGEFGRVYQDRTSYVLEPQLRAPNTTTYPSEAMIPLGALTCDDFRASMEDLRAVSGARAESRAVR